jgi:hypothetical protein
MKPKLLLLLSFMLCAVTANYAQISATQAGIAVQGIARDANNTALASKNISLVFTFYYLDATKNRQTILLKKENLTTDSFGVFSTVIDPGAGNNSMFANNVAYLEIKIGDVIISDEQLRHVPYAISANNGVPTGCIMPFIGTAVPEGWLLCDGKTNVPNPSALYDLIGNKTPDLRAMFLRGTGTNEVPGYTDYSGPALKNIQGQDLIAHKHTITKVETSESGEHTHTDGAYNQLLKNDGLETSPGKDPANGDGEVNIASSRLIPKAGKHTHTLSGSTDENGVAKETRPVNYGVNYIIKL